MGPYDTVSVLNGKKRRATGPDLHKNVINGKSRKLRSSASALPLRAKPFYKVNCIAFNTSATDLLKVTSRTQFERMTPLVENVWHKRLYPNPRPQRLSHRQSERVLVPDEHASRRTIPSQVCPDSQSCH